jgi:hypothetical protein
MRIQPRMVLAVLCLVLVLPAMANAGPSTVSVPDGTRVSELKYGDEEVLTLQPAEQVAFLFVYGIWGLEQDCISADMGVGRLCTLGELARGVKAASGGTLGLAINFVKDTNYNYDLFIIGSDLVIRAIPRVKGLGSFAMMGSGRRSSGNFWYSPSADLTKAVQLTQYGYEGDGFRR